MDQAVIIDLQRLRCRRPAQLQQPERHQRQLRCATGVLTLTGTATSGRLPDALRSIGFDSTSENPGSGVRTVSWTVRDVDSDAAPNGKQTSLAGTTTVNLTPVNDDPVAVNDPTASARPRPRR
jgi:hypothetical protein